MVDIVPEWDEATNIKLGANKVSSVVMSSSIATSVTMWVLKRQINRNKAEPTTNFSRRNSELSRKWQNRRLAATTCSPNIRHQPWKYWNSLVSTSHLWKLLTELKRCLPSLKVPDKSTVIMNGWDRYANSRVCRKHHYANNLSCQ